MDMYIYWYRKLKLFNGLKMKKIIFFVVTIFLSYQFIITNVEEMKKDEAWLSKINNTMKDAETIDANYRSLYDALYKNNQ